MSLIKVNLQSVQQRIHDACLRCGRSPSDVQLLAASKRTDADGVKEAIELGHRLFGENRAQSLRDKYDVVAPEYPQAEWHFIGYLQKNKVKYIVGRATMVHSVDSLELAKSISQRIASQRKNGTPIPDMKVLVQAKFGDEETKTGLPADRVLALCRQIMQIDHLDLCGLMTIPPLSGVPKEWFQQLADLAATGRSEGLPLRELSMGMTSDLEEAIACGSTIIRVGTAIFCAQNP